MFVDEPNWRIETLVSALAAAARKKIWNPHPETLNQQEEQFPD
jgi:hypothetical protein